MSKENRSGLRIFLQYWVLIAVLGAYNFYQFKSTKNMLSLVVGILCAVAFLGWILFYIFYVRKAK